MNGRISAADVSLPQHPARSDFCVEIADEEADQHLLNSGVNRVQEQNNRLLEVFKKTQQNCIEALGIIK